MKKRRHSSGAYEMLIKERKRQMSSTDASKVGLQARLENMIDTITETVCHHVTYGLFGRHQTTFLFMLCCNIMKRTINPDTREPLITKTEWRLFISGASSPVLPEKHASLTSGDNGKIDVKNCHNGIYCFLF